jgi:endonuclease YncB( thermonuclease family)
MTSHLSSSLSSSNIANNPENIENKTTCVATDTACVGTDTACVDTDTLELMACTNDIPLFSFNGLIVKAKIVDIYDGDTFKACFKFKDNIIKYNCRMQGYDAPEMKPLKNSPTREYEKKAALDAKECFLNLVHFNEPKYLVSLHIGKFDKYGRLLATIFTEDSTVSVNERMINSKHGKPYSGGTKEKFSL